MRRAAPTRGEADRLALRGGRPTLMPRERGADLSRPDPPPNWIEKVSHSSALFKALLERRADCAAFYAPEMKGLRIGGVLRVARHKNLRLVFGNWREMARPRARCRRRPWTTRRRSSRRSPSRGPRPRRTAPPAREHLGRQRLQPRLAGVLGLVARALEVLRRLQHVLLGGFRPRCERSRACVHQFLFRLLK